MVSDVAVSYGTESFRSYQFGRETRINPLTTQSISLFLEHGFTDSISLVVTAPYLWIDSLNRGWQDGTLHLKQLQRTWTTPAGPIHLLSAFGGSFPLSSYPTGTDTPIGIRNVAFQGRVVGQFQHRQGWFVHLQTGLDVLLLEPAILAVPVLVRGGYGHRRFFLESWVEVYSSFSSGSDTRIAEGSGSDWLRIGGTLYVPLRAGLGLTAGFAGILDGRNIGLSRRWHAGIVQRIHWLGG